MNVDISRSEAESLVDLLEACDSSGAWRFDLAAEVRAKFGMDKRDPNKVPDGHVRAFDPRVPYDCYWSRRALEAEKLLRSLADEASCVRIDRACHTTAPDHRYVDEPFQGQTMEWCEELLKRAEAAQTHFEKVEAETGVPK